jgi:hypothetical protein
VVFKWAANQSRYFRFQLASFAIHGPTNHCNRVGYSNNIRINQTQPRTKLWARHDSILSILTGQTSRAYDRVNIALYGYIRMNLIPERSFGLGSCCVRKISFIEANSLREHPCLYIYAFINHCSSFTLYNDSWENSQKNIASTAEVPRNAEALALFKDCAFILGYRGIPL